MDNKYTEYQRCHFEKDVDPKNNYYNNISTSCKYYAEQQFNNYLNIKYDGDYLWYILILQVRVLASVEYKIFFNLLFKVTFGIIAIS